VRLYELRSPGRFLAADFFDLAGREREQATLGPDLKAREEWLLAPGASVELDRTLDAETRAVGVAAGYRDLGGAIWRAVAPVSPNRTHSAAITVGRNAVGLEVAPR
jgi:type VI secretion system protein VasD